MPWPTLDDNRTIPRWKGYLDETTQKRTSKRWGALFELVEKSWTSHKSHSRTSRKSTEATWERSSGASET
ncbi:putative dNA-binding transcriptional regulator [Burkholderia pseudomallei MSHR5596]|nr:putative dNA-binding transcriptional regulator [Burkholderia pseudomallei MSHR5596]